MTRLGQSLRKNQEDFGNVEEKGASIASEDDATLTSCKISAVASMSSVMGTLYSPNLQHLSDSGETGLRKNRWFASRLSVIKYSQSPLMIACVVRSDNGAER
jgi:hypothetical protein